ncbi:MAG: glutamyl-tRNA reductase [Ilumatobacteraceae bacterium]
MTIVVIGVNHRTAPIELLERVALGGNDLRKAVTIVSTRTNINEAVVLSTCNRTEVYAVAERFHGALDDILDFFCEVGALDRAELSAHLYSEHDTAAVRHLFEVAAGLESAVLGEGEILRQVRTAWEAAHAEGAARARLNLLFRHAVEAGKRARTETSIGRHTASVSHAAVEMATERLGSLDGRRVLVVGAGEMGAGVAVALEAAGADIVVLNRTRSRAVELAERVGGRVASFADLGTALHEADVLVTCAGGGSTLVDHDLVAAARAGRSAPLLVVDIAIPRDVAPDVAELPGVTLLNLDDLRDWAARGLALRAVEADRVREIVSDEVDRFVVEATAREAAPLVAQLHELFDGVRHAELERFSSRLSTLDDAQRDAVDALTRGIVAKLLHPMSVGLKHQAGTPQGERNAAAVRDLFELD